MKNTFDNHQLDIITPIKIEMDWPNAQELVQTLLEQKERYGITRFALAAPSLGWKTEGFPPLSHYEKLAQLFVQVRDAAKAEGISCGFLNMLTVRSGGGFDPIICANGSAAPAASCPLDPAFQAAFAKANARFAELAEPEFIFFEDDYSIAAQTKNIYGCFCQRHLAAFAEITGKLYTREELLEIFEKKTPEGYALLQQWQQLMGDSMVALSQAVRREVDKKTPQIPIGTMQPFGGDRDGNMTERVARALAGPNHTPFSRIFGAVYCDTQNAKHIPEFLHHTLYSRQHIPGDFCFYHESDTYPHVRFFLSATKMRAIMGAAQSFGLDGATFQTAQILDDRNEEQAYGKMYTREKERFCEASRISKQCSVKGVQISYDPFWNMVEGAGSQPFWTRTVAQFGIPYTTENASVAFWDYRQAKYEPHERVMEQLSKGLFLDGQAAKALCDRGYGQYLGVQLGDNVAEGILSMDDAAREVILPPFDGYSRGKNMAAAQVYSVRRNGAPLQIKITDPKVETVTQVVNFRKEPVTPGMVRFENELGGRVVVMGMTLEKNQSYALFNYRRMRLFQQLVKWCDDRFVLAENEPNIYIIENEAKDGSFIGMLTVTNLGEDPVEALKLHLPPKWQQAKSFKKMDRQGNWVQTQWQRTETALIVSDTLNYCDPLYILAE